MLKIIKFLIWMGKDSALKELYRTVQLAESSAYNFYRESVGENDPFFQKYWEGKRNAYTEVLETIKLIMEREENGKKNLK